MKELLTTSTCTAPVIAQVVALYITLALILVSSLAPALALPLCSSYYLYNLLGDCLPGAALLPHLPPPGPGLLPQVVQLARVALRHAATLKILSPVRYISIYIYII